METAVLFGGSGFVGRRFAMRLVEAGWHVIIPTRQRERVKTDLIVLPNVDVVPCNPNDPKSLTKLVGRADIVVNLVGILHESSKHTFESIHVEFVRRLADTVSQADNVRQVIHFSALNSMTGAPSRYLRSKGKGEAFITKLGRVNWTVIRPSVVFGQGDSFVSMFERLLRYAPVFVLPCPDALFQPIWVDDLSATAMASVHNPKCFNKALNAGGPETLRMMEIIRNIMEVTGNRKPVIPIGNRLSKLMATAMELTPFLPKTLTRDAIDSMRQPSTCENANDASKLVEGRLTSLREYLAAQRAQYPHTESYNEYRHIARRS